MRQGHGADSSSLAATESARVHREAGFPVASVQKGEPDGSSDEGTGSVSEGRPRGMGADPDGRAGALGGVGYAVASGGTGAGVVEQAGGSLSSSAAAVEGDDDRSRWR